jgi:hypothetical protein
MPGEGEIGCKGPFSSANADNVLFSLPSCQLHKPGYHRHLRSSFNYLLKLSRKSSHIRPRLRCNPSFEVWLVEDYLGETAYAHLDFEDRVRRVEQLPKLSLQYMTGFTEKGKEAVKRGLGDQQFQVRIRADTA